MSNLFELQRFARLVSSHFRKNLKGYLISSLVLVGVTVILFLLVVSTRSETIDAGQQFLVYFLVIYGGLFIFSSTIFQSYQRPKEDLFQLMLPASKTEKFLLAWLVSFPLYTICANALYFAVRYVVMHYYAMQGYEIADFFEYDRLFYQVDGISAFKALTLVYVFLHAFAFIGSLIFRKMAVLKIALTLLLAVFAYWAINSLLYRMIFDADIQQAPLLPLMPLYLEDGTTTYRVAIANWPSWIFALALVVTGLLWVASYHKLREKEG